MASIKRRGASWQATYRGPDGRERTKSFRLKVEAEGWVSDELSALRRGAWIDPAAGKITFGDFARSWQAAQVHRPTTAAAIDSHLRTHAFPTFEARPVASIRPSEVQAWVRGISGQLSPATVRVVVQDLRSIFNAAVARPGHCPEPVRRREAASQRPPAGPAARDGRGLRAHRGAPRSVPRACRARSRRPPPLR